MEKIRQTPSQTVGPFFAYGLTARQYGYDYTSIMDGSLVSDGTSGERIAIIGNVFDGAGKVIPDAMVELWQADERGKYLVIPIQNENTGFKGFGRLGTGPDQANRFCFTTIKPGIVNGQAPHINVILFMRGSLRHLYTRLYFSDEVNDKDPLFKSVDVNRRQTLIAKRIERNKAVEYHFDIYMQGEKETVFFDVEK
jgi:protocatechuate 3,4-dioxygenase alpha subunit